MCIFIGVLGIAMSAIMTLLIPFFPFYLICCCLKDTKSLAKILLSYAFGSIFFIIIFSLGLAFSPLIALGNLFFAYYLILCRKVCPYYTFKYNWQNLLKFYIWCMVLIDKFNKEEEKRLKKKNITNTEI